MVQQYLALVVKMSYENYVGTGSNSLRNHQKFYQLVRDRVNFLTGTAAAAAAPNTNHQPAAATLDAKMADV